MLINLSNHPSQNWSEDQRQAAVQQYSEIIDLPFPQIDPEATAKAVQELAVEYIDKIIRMLGYTDVYTFDFKANAVHVMGEMTFAFNVIKLLQQRGITCVASTTERNVIAEQDGKKTLIFKFVQFREYLNTKYNYDTFWLPT